jgi:hypothetical protein
MRQRGHRQHYDTFWQRLLLLLLLLLLLFLLQHAG